jgi:hypothetical protein
MTVKEKILKKITTEKEYLLWRKKDKRDSKKAQTSIDALNAIIRQIMPI